MKTNFFVLCSLLCTIVLGQKHKTDWNRYGLKGKVKELRDVYYEDIDTSANAAIQKLDPAKGRLTIYLYDSSGYLEREAIYGKDYAVKVWMYTYSAPGILLCKMSYSKYDSVGLKYYLRCDDSIVYRYDKRGNKISEDSYYPKGKQIIARYLYSYDDKGNLTSQTAADIAGYRYKYDSVGNLIESIMEGHCRGCPNSSKNTYRYNKSGVLVEEERYGSEFAKTYGYKTVYTYDQYGNVTDMSRYQSDGTSDENVSYRYSYDNKGNWVTKLYYRYEKMEPFYEVRELTYYK